MRAGCVHGVPADVARALLRDGTHTPVKAKAADALALSEAFYAASAEVLTRSPVRPRRVLEAAENGAFGSALQLLPNGRLLRRDVDDDVAPRSIASKEAPPRPWEWRPASAPAPRRPPVASAAPRRATAPAAAHLGPQDPWRRNDAPHMRRPPRADATSRAAYAIWQEAGMPGSARQVGLVVAV